MSLSIHRRPAHPWRKYVLLFAAVWLVAAAGAGHAATPTHDAQRPHGAVSAYDDALPALSAGAAGLALLGFALFGARRLLRSDD